MVHAQAEELPPPAADMATAPVVPQTTASPIPASTVPAEPPSPLASPSAAVARDHGWVLIPYFGLNLPVAAATRNYSAGFRLGGLVGWALTPRFSINGEFALDLMDGDTDSSMLRPHEYYLDFGLSPLFHFQSGKIVVGPKLGWYTNHRSYSDSDSAAFQEWMATHDSRVGYTGPILEAHSSRGFLFGINAGGFIFFDRMTIGLLASASFRHFTTVDCGAYGCVGDYGLATIMSLSLAALF
jgi:hypothetical protein